MSGQQIIHSIKGWKIRIIKLDKQKTITTRIINNKGASNEKSNAFLIDCFAPLL
jgi:hypothetical protein